MAQSIPSLPDAVGGSSDLPASFAEVASPGVDFSTTSRGLYIGTAGDLTVIMAGDGSEHTFVGVLSGSILPIRCTQVTSATTASSISILY